MPGSAAPPVHTLAGLRLVSRACSRDTRGVLHVGPFELLGVLGRGGMATVWRARHRDHPVPVALKVIKAVGADRGVLVSAIRNEIRAAAALDHPAIVRVYDAGEVSDEAAAGSNGALEAGSPWFVMELVEGSTLGRLRNMVDWPGLHRTLLSVLDALAHAHARGILHRDIKPGNVLLAQPDGRAKLTDFGLAHALDRADREQLDVAFVGTPQYMAPEQMTCSWRDYGPWTDLYAVGCLTWRLVTGDPPFGPSSSVEEQMLRRATPLGAFEPRIDVPDGVEAWLRHLLEPRVERRFTSATVAAWYLAQLPGADTGVSLALNTLAPFARSARTQPTLDAATGRRSLWPAPELPERWELPQDRAAPTEPLGLGLGLLGLRQLPVVGRSRERDALWDAFVQTHRSRRARVVVLHGPDGCGKSRLARWLAERVGELGVGVALGAHHGASPSAGDGIAAMAIRALRAEGLDRSELSARIGELESGRLRGRGLAAQELVDVLASDDPSDETGSHQSRASRYAAVAQLVRALAAEQTAVVCVDDAHRGVDALTWTKFLLGAGGADCPALLVLTARVDDLVAGSRERALLDAVVASEHTEVMRVGPLPEAQRPALIREVLRLEPRLATEVETRTAGNPAFAIELVSHWVHAGALKAGPRGYELRVDASVDFPDGLEEVWRDRLDRFVAAAAEPERVGLLIAALLGGGVDPSEWRRACAAAGDPVAEAVLHRLLAARLAVAAAGGAQEGWSLANDLLGEWLTQDARAAGRLAELHRACAQALQEGGAAAARVGLHLRRGGELRACLLPLLDGARAELIGGNGEAADGLLQERDEAMRELGVPDLDDRWARGWTMRALAAQNDGEYDEADRWAARVTDVDGEGDWARPQARALLIRGRLAFRRGRGDAVVTLQLAQLRARQLGDDRLRADCGLAIAAVHARRGDRESAGAEIAAARALYEALGYELGLAQCLIREAALLLQTSETAAAAGRLADARERFERLGAARNVADTVMALGDAHRRLGDLPAAEACYVEATKRLRSLGASGWLYSELNRALVEIARRSWKDAADRVETVLRGAERLGSKSLEAFAHAALLAPAAGLCRWPRFDAHTARARELLEETGATEWDVMWVLGVAATLAEASGQERRALRVGRLEQEQRRRLNLD